MPPPAAARELTEEEARAFGLLPAQPRELTAEEAAAFGLAPANEAPAPVPARDGAVRFLTGDGEHSALTRVLAPFRSAAQVLTLGAADEIGGGLGAVLGHIGAAVGLGDKKPFKQRLDEQIDEYRRLDREAAEASPVGTAFGQVTSMLAPVGAVGNVVSTAGKVAASGGMGAVSGFLSSEGSPAERAPGALLGAGVGLGTGLVASGQTGKVVELATNPKKLLELGGRGASAGYAIGHLVGRPNTGAAIGAGTELAGRAIAKLRARLAPSAVRAPVETPSYAPSVPKVMTEEWGEQAATGLSAPKVGPGTKSAPPGPDAFEPPRSRSWMDERTGSVDPNETVSPLAERLRAKLDAKRLEPPAKAPRTPRAPRAPRAPASVPAEPAAKDDTSNPLREELKRRLSTAPKSAIPEEDRSTVDALRNIVSSESRAGNIPGLQHYPTEPDVAFKEYLAQLPKSTGGTAAQKAKALSALKTDPGKGGDVGELIYRARAAGASDEQIMRAVGVRGGKSVPVVNGKPSAARVPTSDEDLMDLLRQSVRGDQ